MAIKPYNKTLPPHQNDPDCPTCEEMDLPTQRSINSERNKYCKELTWLAGEVSKSEQNYEGLSNQYEHKKCLFVWTQKNYHIYRNLVICVGTELIQTTDSVKENIGIYTKLNTDLSGILKNLFKSAKDVKTKFTELRDQACKLEHCINDSCNAIQLGLLTGKSAENCKGETKPTTEVPEACQDAEDILDELICMPKALSFDIDSIFKSSSEVIGIQVFSNITSLDPLHKTFTDYAKEFDKLILDSMKLRENDMKKLQEELIKTLQEATKSSMTRLKKRSEFEGLRNTLEYICCPECGCVEGNGNCDPRLKACECELCEICDQVKTTFCPEPEHENEPEHEQHQHEAV